MSAEEIDDSGTVLGQLVGELSGSTMTKGSLHFPVDRPLPTAIVKRLIAVRLREAGLRERWPCWTARVAGRSPTRLRTGGCPAIAVDGRR